MIEKARAKAAGLPLRFEVLDMEAMRKQLRAVWGKNGPDDNAEGPIRS